jgi:glycosyltransferase involved in cell wall biosynthesis
LPNPLFSIVIPTYDRPDLLGRALASIRRQTVPELEVVVVDDASPEPIEPRVEASGIERLRVVRQAVNRGSAAARNEGIRAARGSWIAFLDDDDELMPRFLERMGQAIDTASPRPGWAWCGALIIDDARGSEPVGRTSWAPQVEGTEETYLRFLAGRKIGTCGLCVRRDCFDRVGLFDEGLRAAEDTDLLLRLARAFPFTAVPEPLVKIHRHSGPQAHSDLGNQARAYRHIAARHARALREHPEIGARLDYKTAWLHYHAGEPRWGRLYMRRALRRRPWSPRRWLAAAGFELLGPLSGPLHRFLARLKKRLRLTGPAP